jgi:signal transduction histidine kinase
VADLELSELYEVAARAQINQRCAMAYLHDIRGSMQALFSAIELLSRTARSADGDQARIDKACALAKRAVNNHEKATLDALQALTLQHSEPIAVDVGALVSQVVHFLRNEASIKGVTVAVDVGEAATISADRTKFLALLVGLVTAAIDETPAGQELRVSARRSGDDAVISINSDAGYSGGGAATLPDPASGRLSSRELTRVFAQRFLTAHGGRLEITTDDKPHGSLHLVYPALVGLGSRSLAASRESLTEK